MNSIPTASADVEADPSISNKKSTAKVRKKHQRGMPGEGTYILRKAGEEKPPSEWHKFSQSIAFRINPETPDISGACLLYGISLWMKIAKTRKFSYCYRSLSQLAVEHPYLSEEGIRKAIARLAEAFKGDFKKLEEGKTMRFSVSDRLMKEMDNSEKLMFRIKHAEDHGIPAALLLANLSWQFLPTWNVASPYRKEISIKDDDGNEYYPMNPVLLTQELGDGLPILPMSRWTFTRAAKELVVNKVLATHPKQKHYYAFFSNLLPKKGPQLSGKVDANGAKVASDGAKVADDGAKVADFPCVDSNEIVNEDSNVFFPDTESASPPLRAGVASRLGQPLRDMCNQIMRDLKSKPVTPPRITTVPASQLPYDEIRSPLSDLPYDHIPLSPHTGRPYLHTHQVRDWMEDIAMGLRLIGFRYTRKDLDDIQNIFLHVRSFTLEDFEDICRHSAGWVCTIFGEEIRPPKVGEFDYFFFARKIRSARDLVRYLPELIEEMHTEVFTLPGEKEWDRAVCLPEAYKNVLSYLRPLPIGKEVVNWDVNPMEMAA